MKLVTYQREGAQRAGVLVEADRKIVEDYLSQIGGNA